MKIHAPVLDESGDFKKDPVSNREAALCGMVASDYDNALHVDVSASQNNAKMVSCKKCLAKWFNLRRTRKSKSKDQFMLAYEKEKAEAKQEVKPKPRTPEQKEIASLRGVIRYMQNHLSKVGYIERGRFVTPQQVVDELMAEIGKV